MSVEESKAVFLSYASQDAEAARRICESLRAAGVEVWLDQEGGLVGGDAWDRKIRDQIGSCALFVPLISASAQARKEGYFRLEWKLAAQRTHMMSERTAFLLPVVIDATRDAEADVPAEFRAVQWTRLADGEPSAAFCARVKKLLGGDVARAAPTVGARLVRAQEDGRGQATPLRRKRSSVVMMGASLVVLVVIGVAVAVSRKSDSPAMAAPIAAIAADDKSALADKSIAVLPFANLSDDKENTAFFSDGMHEDILTTLANIPELRVISRTSVMEYRGTTKKIPQIARELGVAYILEGSVRRAGNQIRLTGQLIRAAKDEHLWAKSYDRELTPKDIFAIQAALATEIAGALQAAISPAAKKLVERRPTENLAAYDLYLKARNLAGRTGRSREKLLQDAVALDPNFAEAWGELAYAHARAFSLNIDRTPERLVQADAAIARAVRLAPDAPEVIRTLGAYAQFGYNDYARAEVQYQKVLRLQPNNSDAILDLGRVQASQRRWLEALDNFRKAAELDQGNLGTLNHRLCAVRRWDEAIAVRQRIVALKNTPAERWELALDIFAATGSTRDIDEFVDRLTPAERDSAPFVPMQKERAIIRGEFAEWKRLDALVPIEASIWGRQPSEQAVDAALVFAAHGDLTGARARLGSQPAELRSTLERDPANARLWDTLAKKRRRCAMPARQSSSRRRRVVMPLRVSDPASNLRWSML